MRLDERCTDCLVSRVRLECALCNVSKDREERVVEECTKLLGSFSGISLPHPQTASAVHRCACRLIGCDDPFAELKIKGDQEALAVADTLIPQDAGFRELVLASIIGNTYDYGVMDHEVADDFTAYYKSEYDKGLFLDDTRRMLDHLGNVVYFTDNCGEIVFDRLVVRYLKSLGSRVTVVVRDAPILNDATLTEATALGVDREADLLVTGGAGNELGIRFDLMSPRLLHDFDTASLVISKGMANYESLREYDDLPPVAYLLAAKCLPIAEDLGVPHGSKVAMLRE
jgi:uncharacterized protein with ATP-grasp and redox domains